MLTNTTKWSHAAGNHVVPSRWQATFPNRESIIRLVGAVLAEQHDAWAEQRRYIGLDVLTRCHTALTEPTEPTQEVSTTLVPALTA